jgi:AraC-like DNA-binding protein
MPSGLSKRWLRRVECLVPVLHCVFKELVGETPLEYLTSWSMQKAAALLQKGDRKLIDVARSLGYDSDAAFSKAFKRVVSVTPRDSRQRSQGRVGEAGAPAEPPAVS